MDGRPNGQWTDGHSSSIAPIACVSKDRRIDRLFLMKRNSSQWKYGWEMMRMWKYSGNVMCGKPKLRISRNLSKSRLSSHSVRLWDAWNLHGGFHSHGGTPNGLFIMENTMQMDDLGTLFQETSTCSCIRCFQATLLHSDSHDTRHRLHTELLHCLCTG